MTHCHDRFAAGSRPLPLVMRADLEFQMLRFRGGRAWTVKDAVAERYWQLEEEECFLLRSLDGRTSADKLREKFSRQFAPRRLTTQRLTAFLARLHDEGLIVVNRPGQADIILERQARWRRDTPWRALGHLLAWRFRGIDPDRWLNACAPRLGWLFTGRSAAAYVMLLLSAILLAVVQWPAFDREISDLTTSLEAQQVLLFLVAIAGAKVLHELGHAVACKHYGGECHELGLMLFLGAPSLYCNVSDAWMLKEKRHRIVISAAGILVELGLAAACTWLWWFTHAGLIHSLALYGMIACSVNTLFLNGNPLLQYDGYYVLADLTETPNLRQQASAAVRRFLARLVLGVRIEADGWIHHPRQTWLVLYGIASSAYRWVVTIVVLWFLHDLLEPYDMQIVSWLIAALLLFTLLAVPIAATLRFFRRPAWDSEIRWGLVGSRAVVLLAAFAALLGMPLPFHVAAPVVLEPRGARSVYVEVEGRLEWAMAAGAEVKKGDVVARLKNHALERELEELIGERNAKRKRLESLLRRQADPEAAAQIPTAEKSLWDAEERLAQRRRDVERLVIRAPAAGVVLPPPQKATEPKNRTWVGTPLDEHNLGCHLQSGKVICVLGSPHVMDGIVFVHQEDTDLVRAGQPVELWIDSFPNRKLAGTVAVEPTTRAKTLPDDLVMNGELPFQRDSSGEVRPKEARYSARVQLREEDEALLIGATGRARVVVAPRSIASRTWRQVSQTFRLP